MIPWIQVYSNLPTHKKTGLLVDYLGLKNSHTSPNLLASGILVGLWTWAAQNALDGDLSDCSAQTIANACGWRKKPDVLVNALVESGFIDADMKLHDWEEYAVLLMESEENRKGKTRERVKRYRDKQRNKDVTAKSVTSSVTVTRCNAPAIPNHTLPTNTTDYNKEEGTTERYTSADGDGGCRGETNEVIKAFCNKINPMPSGMCLAELEEFAADMGEDVCLRAFDIALDAKKANWNYIRGILRNAKQRGVTCLADFEALEQKHQEEVSAKKYGKQPFASARLAPDAVSDVEKAALAKLMGDCNDEAPR